MDKNVSEDDFDLLDELGVDTTPQVSGGRTPKQERIVAGFEEIVRFYEEHQRLPRNVPGADVFERIYAVRLERIRESQECRLELAEMDRYGFLSLDETTLQAGEAEPDEDLLAELGIEDDITDLQHVRPRAEIRAAEEIAHRAPCTDFAVFRPLFTLIQEQLQSGVRQTRKFQQNADVNEGEFFILEGQKVFVAQVGEKFVTDYGKPDCRLRLIFDNGTESDMLLRSFQRALYRDETSRRIITLDHGPLFSQHKDDCDTITGTIYVLRSRSDHDWIIAHREVIHKIGVTTGEVKRRIANAKKDPTFLLADVEIVATYQLANLDAHGVEQLLHRFFASARMDVELQDRFGIDVTPQEWFLLPLPVIEDAISKLIDGTLHEFDYDQAIAKIVRKI